MISDYPWLLHSMHTNNQLPTPFGHILYDLNTCRTGSIRYKICDINILTRQVSIAIYIFIFNIKILKFDLLC